MTIAMKCYLIFPLFFLQTLCCPLSIFADEHHVSSSSSAPKSAEQSFDDEEDQNQVEFNQHAFDNDSEDKRFNLDLHDVDERWNHQLSHEAESFEKKFFNMLIVLGLLIGFMFLASWALKRMMKSKLSHLNTGSAIKLLETRYLSPRATLYFIEIEGQTLLIAESPTAVTHLKTFPLQKN
ncbi:MAG: FliO/MopB family protein [Parachlamydiaceae bacterium]